ncbi:CHP725-containing protein [Crocosphaera subtropica ATCC 51142]|uniref:CHP725-containing protein n=1 Tax=Crocosphaera subtropica (strain ATCC 51142 / BH68) TaxID=43989 RepID=B1WX38_CROS5|nr:TIGR00725 family protein [Crocosphaera subtropica]ACB54104.1 CHP725-containing protein [Crocosphaera subtropica ATCC 51142]
MTRKIIIGVMGPGDSATEIDIKNAYELGKLIAQQDWILLTGGRNVGVMDAANKGAKEAGGLTIGILPSNHTKNVSDAVDIAILTDLGNARNNINVLSSDIIVACGIGLGTVSEIALALKNRKPVILLSESPESQQLFKSFAPNLTFIAVDIQQTMKQIKEILEIVN